mmetsp:Transcript_12103/g.48721  ORF Transcript_12103/g.48721 Transcript_12103/m.48721 type:complete len:374 (+) Transcript_12103:500-1621(+)
MEGDPTARSTPTSTAGTTRPPRTPPRFGAAAPARPAARSSRTTTTTTWMMTRHGACRSWAASRRARRVPRPVTCAPASSTPDTPARAMTSFSRSGVSSRATSRRSTPTAAGTAIVQWPTTTRGERRRMVFVGVVVPTSQQRRLGARVGYERSSSRPSAPSRSAASSHVSSSSSVGSQGVFDGACRRSAYHVRNSRRSCEQPTRCTGCHSTLKQTEQSAQRGNKLLVVHSSRSRRGGGPRPSRECKAERRTRPLGAQYSAHRSIPDAQAVPLRTDAPVLSVRRRQRSSPESPSTKYKPTFTPSRPADLVGWRSRRGGAPRKKRPPPGCGPRHRHRRRLPSRRPSRRGRGPGGRAGRWRRRPRSSTTRRRRGGRG